tara:strand:+ start:1836 stop:2531 length:696 start_codon:yes stop_codon:yes gene_type:complete
MKLRNFTLLSIILLVATPSLAQVESGKTGAWYMYFYDTQFKESNFGIQGDIQYRNWNLGGDLEQLLLRSGLTFRVTGGNAKFTLGYAHITSGAFGDSDDTSTESRIYQEALLSHKLGNRVFLAHRFRYEQRFVEAQDFRTRYRYNLFINVPFNKSTLDRGAFYAALYNELFVNGQRDIGDNREVEFFDRNRTYLGVGYVLKKGMKLQLGWMSQKTNSVDKQQMQLSFHHNF